MGNTLQHGDEIQCTLRVKLKINQTFSNKKTKSESKQMISKRSKDMLLERVFCSYRKTSKSYQDLNAQNCLIRKQRRQPQLRVCVIFHLCEKSRSPEGNVTEPPRSDLAVAGQFCLTQNIPRQARRQGDRVTWSLATRVVHDMHFKFSWVPCQRGPFKPVRLWDEA